jgi:polyisoprenoid-binding protein YceI
MIRRRYLTVLATLLLCAGAARADEQMFQADPAQSRVEFTLGDILHTVHGSFQLRRGIVRFDTATGAASGELVVDAASGDSGSKARDRRMKRDILQTDRYPEITFTAEHVSGSVSPDGTSTLQFAGEMTLHGQSHPMILTIPVRVSGETASADAQFVIPYVQWGLKNPSTFLLRVSDKVNIAVHLAGRLATCAGGTCTAAAGR